MENRLPQIEVAITQIVPVNANERMLICKKQGVWTYHTLTVGGDYYICQECGNPMAYFVNDAKDGRAMDLQETQDATDRFMEWLNDD